MQIRHDCRHQTLVEHRTAIGPQSLTQVATFVCDHHPLPGDFQTLIVGVLNFLSAWPARGASWRDKRRSNLF